MISPNKKEQSLEYILQSLVNSPITKVAFFLASLLTSLDNIVDNLTTKELLTYDDVY